MDGPQGFLDFLLEKEEGLNSCHVFAIVCYDENLLISRRPSCRDDPCKFHSIDLGDHGLVETPLYLEAILDTTHGDFLAQHVKRALIGEELSKEAAEESSNTIRFLLACRNLEDLTINAFLDSQTLVDAIKHLPLRRLFMLPVTLNAFLMFVNPQAPMVYVTHLNVGSFAHKNDVQLFQTSSLSAVFPALSHLAFGWALDDVEAFSQETLTMLLSFFQDIPTLQRIIFGANNVVIQAIKLCFWFHQDHINGICIPGPKFCIVFLEMPAFQSSGNVELEWRSQIRHGGADIWDQAESLIETSDILLRCRIICSTTSTCTSRP